MYMYSVFSRVCTCVCYLACDIQIYGMSLKILELKYYCFPYTFWQSKLIWQSRYFSIMVNKKPVGFCEYKEHSKWMRKSTYSMYKNNLHKGP